MLKRNIRICSTFEKIDICSCDNFLCINKFKSAYWHSLWNLINQFSLNSILRPYEKINENMIEIINEIYFTSLFSALVDGWWHWIEAHKIFNSNRNIKWQHSKERYLQLWTETRRFLYQAVAIWQSREER